MLEGPATAEGDGWAAGCIMGCGGAGPMFGGTTILTTRGHCGPDFAADQLVAWVAVVVVRIRYGCGCAPRLPHGTDRLGTPLAGCRDLRYRRVVVFR